MSDASNDLLNVLLLQINSGGGVGGKMSEIRVVSVDGVTILREQRVFVVIEREASHEAKEIEKESGMIVLWRGE
jgi:hypothetical protein